MIAPTLSRGAAEPRARVVRHLARPARARRRVGRSGGAAAALLPRLLGSRAQLRDARAAARRALPRAGDGRARSRRLGLGGRLRVAHAHPRRRRRDALARPRRCTWSATAWAAGTSTDAARAVPELVRQVVNIDGFGPPPLTPDGGRAPARALRRRTSTAAAPPRARPDWRPYAEPRRARRAPPRAEPAPVASSGCATSSFTARAASADGWRWKADPLLAHGFGPWRPDWIAPGYARVAQPMLAIVGSEHDTWGPLPEAIVGPRLAGVRAARARDRRRRRALRPHGAARRDGAADPRLPRRLMRIHHARTAIELHELAHGDGLPLLLLHALDGSSADWGELPALWPGRVYRARLLRPRRVGVAARRRLLARAAARRRRRGPRAHRPGRGGRRGPRCLRRAAPRRRPPAIGAGGAAASRAAASPAAGAQPDFDRPFLTALTPADHAPLPPGCDPLVCALDLDPAHPSTRRTFAAAARRLLLLEDGDARPPWWEAARASATARESCAERGNGRGAPGHAR